MLKLKKRRETFLNSRLLCKCTAQGVDPFVFEKDWSEWWSESRCWIYE